MDKIASGGFAANDEIVFAKKAERISVPICEKTTVTELSDDFTLPDYRPEIRRLLKISAILPPPSSYVSPSAAEFSGDVIYNVLYVGGDGKLNSVELTAVYEADAELERSDDGGAVSAVDEVEAENVTGRVVAPRKLNIRCRLRHTVRAEEEQSLEVDMIGEGDGENIMRLTDTGVSCVRICGEDDSFEIEENLSLPGDARVICGEAVPLIGDCELKNGEVSCRGALYLKVLYDIEGGSPSLLEKKIPFEAAIPINGEGEGWECRVHGCATSVSTDINESGAVCRIRLALSAEAQKNLPAKLTKDIFATDRACEVTSESMRVCVAACCSNGNFTVSGSSELSGLPDSFEIVSSSATAEAEELSAENGKYHLTGNVVSRLSFLAMESILAASLSCHSNMNSALPRATRTITAPSSPVPRFA